MAEPISGTNDRLKYWIWLTLVFGAGSTRVYDYLSQNENDPQAVYESLTSAHAQIHTPALLRAVKTHSLSEAESILYYCNQHQITLLAVDSDGYPDQLRAIYAPPVLLTMQGNAALLNNPLSLAVVGTRNPSPYTHKVVNSLLTELSHRGFVIVSGFAKGVDAAAHSAALSEGGGTIGVLGCGVNVNYPRENAALREEMLSSGKGLLLSEYLPGVQPVPANFPRRNRILSGLAHATAVMEAAARSGSLITANCACEQGRYLLCVPPADLFDLRYAGVIPLLRDGAIPLMSYQDVLMLYYLQYPQYIRMPEDGIRDSERLVFQDQQTPAAGQSKRKRKAGTSVSAEPEAEPLFQPELLKTEPDAHADAPAAADQTETAGTAEAMLPESEEGQQIVRYLREHGETYADDIASALDMDLSVLLGELTVLELDGFVETLFGKRYRAADTVTG